MYKTTCSRSSQWNFAVKTEFPMFFVVFFTSLNRIKISVHVFTRDLLWSLEFGSSPICNCFTMSLLNGAVTNTQMSCGTPIVGFLITDLKNLKV